MGSIDRSTRSPFPNMRANSIKGINPDTWDPMTTLSWLPFVKTKQQQQQRGGGKPVWLDGLPLSNPYLKPLSVSKKQKSFVPLFESIQMEKTSSRKKVKPFPVPRTTMGFVLYGSKSCPFCNQARLWLDWYQIPFTYHDIDELVDLGVLEERADLWKKLGVKRIGTQRTIPIIFLNGERIGGYTDLLAWGKECGNNLIKYSRADEQNFPKTGPPAAK